MKDFFLGLFVLIAIIGFVLIFVTLFVESNSLVKIAAGCIIGGLLGLVFVKILGGGGDDDEEKQN